MAQQNNFFGWQQLPSIPDAVGFTGSYAGVSNGALLVGGGANFPDGIGADGTGHYTNVWSWQWKNGTLVTDTSPSLPQTFANGTGAILDNTLLYSWRAFTSK